MASAFDPRDREDVLEMEERILGPFATRAPGRGRVHPEPADPNRSPFQRDRDRILHGRAFRRLQSKTQVYAVEETADRARTRLTHTLEVSQIARSMARRLGANQDLTEAVALAHDLGHPPFGHGGERTLDELSRDAGGEGFDHNVQALRILTELESPYPAFRGLNPTWELREGIARHETPYDAPSVPDEFRAHRRPSLEAQIANVADFIAYVSHDLEDAIRIDLVAEAAVDRVGEDLVGEVLDRARSARDSLPAGESSRADEVFLRALTRGLISRLIDGAIAETSDRLSALPEGTVEALREADRPVCALPDDLAAEAEAIRGFLHREVYDHPRVLIMIEKGCRALRQAYEYFRERPTHLPRAVQVAAWDGGAPPDGPARSAAIVDHLAARTDREVMDLHRTIFEI